MYTLKLNGKPTASFRHFGCANRAAFDDLPGFHVLQPDDMEVTTEVVNASGQRTAHYLVRRGRLALPLEP